MHLDKGIHTHISGSSITSNKRKWQVHFYNVERYKIQGRYCNIHCIYIYTHYIYTIYTVYIYTHNIHCTHEGKVEF